jgi:saccharopine dehydrogenase-like NADP-dependent oxidoreductase
MPFTQRKETIVKKNVLIIGAGGVGHAAVHKCARHNDLLGDLCLAARRKHKCDEVIESVRKKGALKDPAGKLHARSIDAMDTAALVSLIKETGSSIVINVGQTYINLAVLDACIKAGVVYIDTGSYDEPDDENCDLPPRYEQFEWRHRERCAASGITAILGAGFDPGVTNAYCASAAKHHFDAIDAIDILDVNAGSHGKYFATNFDPEINFREFTRVFSRVEGRWVEDKIHSVKRVYDFPVVGELPVYLTAHDEVHSLWKTLGVPTVRFWMGFSDHYINVFNVLTRIGMTSTRPVKMGDGTEFIPLKALKAVLPDPLSLAPGYTGKTCIGCLVKGKKDGAAKELFIYNVCDHQACYAETGSQAISYTAAVPAVAAAMLVAQGVWNPRTMVNVEELDPDPYIALLDTIGLPTEYAAGVRQVR